MANEQANKEVAIIAVGGKQHLVRVGARIDVNRLDVKEGDILTETDLLKKAPVALKVVAHKLGKKINGLKFHRKVRYTRHYGHRQQLTELEVMSVGGKAKIETETAAVKEEAVKSVVKKTVAKKPVAKKTVTTKGKKNV